MTGSNAKRSNRQIEAGEQIALIEWADCHWWGPLLMMIANGAYLAGTEQQRRFRGRMLKREGLRPGVPDLLLAWPRKPYSGLFIELKSPPGYQSRISANQAYYLEFLRDCGYRTVTCRGADAAITIIKTYMGSDLVKRVSMLA